MKHFVLVVCAVLAAGIFVSNAHADFSSALAKTVSEIPDGADVAAMGNANTALPSDYSTRNPGAVDAIDGLRSTYGASVMYLSVPFAHGPSINLYEVSAGMHFPVGSLQVTFTNGGSNTGTLDVYGDSVKFGSFPSIDMQYGLRVGKNLLLTGDELYVGVGYAYSESKLTTQMLDSESMDFYNIVSKSTGHELETGMLYRMSKKISFGAMYLHSWDREEDTLMGYAERSHSQSDQLRLGVSAKLTSMTLISFDYRHLYLTGASDNQFNVGFEQYIIKDVLAIYGGYADGGLTTGIGVYATHGGINFAYMHRPFRATEEYFGTADAFVVQAYMNF